MGVFGIKGWVKVDSYTRPPENILDYPCWQLCQGDKRREMRLVSGNVHGKGLIAQLADATGKVYDDRDQAAILIGSEITVLRDELPRPAQGVYYWADLIGLEIEHLDGRKLGQVTGLFETGAHDVLVVKDGERERLIPFVNGPIVQAVDLAAGRIRVDWDPEY